MGGEDPVEPRAGELPHDEYSEVWPSDPSCVCSTGMSIGKVSGALNNSRAANVYPGLPETRVSALLFTWIGLLGGGLEC